jgi:hypothetical protein
MSSTIQTARDRVGGFGKIVVAVKRRSQQYFALRLIGCLRLKQAYRGN